MCGSCSVFAYEASTVSPSTNISTDLSILIRNKYDIISDMWITLISDHLNSSNPDRVSSAKSFLSRFSDSNGEIPYFSIGHFNGQSMFLNSISEAYSAYSFYNCAVLDASELSTFTTDYYQKDYLNVISESYQISNYNFDKDVYNVHQVNAIGYAHAERSLVVYRYAKGGNLYYQGYVSADYAIPNELLFYQSQNWINFINAYRADDHDGMQNVVNNISSDVKRVNSSVQDVNSSVQDVDSSIKNLDSSVNTVNSSVQDVKDAVTDSSISQNDSDYNLPSSDTQDITASSTDMLFNSIVNAVTSDNEVQVELTIPFVNKKFTINSNSVFPTDLRFY